MGDFKPNLELKAKLPQAVLLGIDNHRLVDRETDQFLPVKELKTRFRKGRRRYAGVVTDIAFDYFLIKHWQKFAKLDFAEFTSMAYKGLHSCHHLMPPRMQLVTNSMIEHQWLNAYSTLEGIATTIDQVSKRIRFENNMAGSVVEVERHYDEIERVFMLLFDHLINAVEQASIESAISQK